MRAILIIISSIAVLFGAATVRADDGAGHAAASDDPRFEFLKSLAGTWLAEPHHEGGEPLVFEFRVTAGGHAVEEREMAGTPMEMLTVYHMEGRSLVATHYCMMGNQPRVVAANRIVDNSLTFDCDGKPGNTKSHDDDHVHGWTMHLDGDTMHYTGTMVKGGELTDTPAFVLSR